MKNLISLLIGVNLFANYYMGKIEPYQKFEIESEVSGAIEFVDISKDFTYIDRKSLIVEIDKSTQEIELEGLKNSLSIQTELLKLKMENAKAKEQVSKLSQYEKNLEKLAVLEIENSIANIETQIASLENIISKKSIYIDKKYLSKIYVNEKEYINMGEKLFESFDFSKAKITLFVREEDIENLNSKRVYVDDKISKFRVEKVSKLKDESRVSLYRVRVVKDKPDIESFSKIVKVEFK